MEYILLLQLLITEIHATPAAGEPEWVECVVTSTSPIQLDEYLVCDNATCVPLPRATIQRGMLFVVTRDPEVLHETRMISDSTVVVKCAMPSLNNTSDCVEIRRRDSSLIDRSQYSILASGRGRSIERHGTSDNGFVTYNDVWSASMAFDSATCARVNSHVEYERDVAITGYFVQDSIVRIGLVNNGRIPASGQQVLITVGQHQFIHECPDLQPKQWWSTQLELMQLLPTACARSDVVTVELPMRDMRTENNVFRSTIVIPPMNGGVMITEILADPRETDCDFVEIWNGTTDSLDMFGWTLQDDGGDICRILQHVIVPPNDYVACASDTAIVRMCNGELSGFVRPSLNIHSLLDSVTLRTPSGFVADKAVYDKSWHSQALVSAKGRSLEKRVPEARNTSASDWGSSTDVDGSTPGTSNTIEFEVLKSFDILRASPSPFSTLRSAGRHPCVISWTQPFDQATARMYVLRLDGSIVAELLNGEFIGRQGAVTWDGVNSVNAAPLPIGIYIAAFECIDAGTQRVVRGTCPVVIGESR